MDPLSVAASVITVIQSVNAIIKFCYDVKAAVKKAPWSLSRMLDELKDFRNVLETTERHVHRQIEMDFTGYEKPSGTQILRETLASCTREVSHLQEQLNKSSVGELRSRSAACAHVLKWHLKESDAKTCLERIERCKSTLKLALTTEEVALLDSLRALTSDMNNGIQGINDNIIDFRRQMDTRYNDERFDEILQWLSPLDATEGHKRTNDVHQKGTSDWFIRCEEFCDWLRAANGQLWLSVFPGAGKTGIFSRVVTYLVANVNECCPGALMAYFYCDFRNSDAQDSLKVLGSLVAQLCSQSRRFPEVLEQSFQRKRNSNGRRTRPSRVDLMEAMNWFAQDGRIILLIDAIDECGTRDVLLDAICDVRGSFNVLLSSRNEIDIHTKLTSFCRVRLECHQTEMDHDIGAYIDNQLMSDKKLQWLEPAVKHEIKSRLRCQSAGMFRWAQCQMDTMVTLRTVKGIRAALEELPDGLDDTYERILTSIPPKSVQIARKVLSWLAFAVLPLTLQELHAAIAIDPKKDYLDKESCLSSPEEILSLCGSLITVVDQGHVTLAHLSVKDYLLSAEIRLRDPVAAFAMLPTEANHELSIDCLSYLSFRELATGPAMTCDDYVARLTTCPLLKHAAIGWAYYFRAAKMTPDLRELAVKFFGSQMRGNFMSWVQVLNAASNFEWDFYPRHATSLYYASCFGLKELVEDSIATTSDIDAPGSRFGGTALHGAVLRNHLEVMRLLLAAGADPNRADFDGVTPLHTAVTRATADEISLLLDFGASPDNIDGVGETPREWASKSGRHDSIDVLLGRSPKDVGVRKDGKESGQRVWKPSDSYFPDFRRRRSGLESSFVVKVEIGTDIVV